MDIHWSSSRDPSVSKGQRKIPSHPRLCSITGNIISFPGRAAWIRFRSCWVPHSHGDQCELGLLHLKILFPTLVYADERNRCLWCGSHVIAKYWETWWVGLFRTGTAEGQQHLSFPAPLQQVACFGIWEVLHLVFSPSGFKHHSQS